MSFDESIKKIELVLSCNGLTIRSRYNDVRTRWKNRFLFIFNMIWFNSEAICGVAWMVLRLNEGGTIAEVTYMAPCALFTLLSVLKALLFIYYEDNICDLVASLRKLDIKYNNKSISSEDIDFLHFTLKLSKILNAMLCVVFSWSTLVVSCIFYIKDGVFDVIFPLKVEYPFSFDHNDARLWPFVYIHQFWSVNEERRGYVHVSRLPLL
ncbi:olfactory receptor 24 [Danaus plexippus plexippus]|uniref:Olfactory receptor 24 n=1 Tax=Danaus plexippus plexippus TaxID=278856 RepID=A0A212EHJ4_DANPL|nr:olfactory receptor 24 [Danaus plexippus plexippus]